MKLDNYAPCPCGSGKKMKFCKCVDQPQEYDKIVRFIDGGQEIAAVDRINQLLAKSPNSAWLLALKGELALSLGEIDTFKETAQRFLKLKPDNPLALTMRSFVALLDHEPLENAARMLLEGLAESRESLPSLVLPTLQLLTDQLRASPKAPLRFFWTRLFLALRGNEEQSEQQSQPDPGTPSDNLVAMSPISLPTAHPVPALTERSNEVAALLSAFRYAQAETKLRAILRDYPDQPGPLAQLLQVQLVLLDQSGATTTARKLSLMRGLEQAQRDYFAALALEIEPEQPGLRAQLKVKFCEIESDDAAREALSKLEFIDEAADEPSKDFRQALAHSIDDEVPAKHVFNIVGHGTLDSGETHYYSTGTVALFAKQTDKPARALIMSIDRPNDHAAFEQLTAAVQPKTELQDPRPRHFSYVEAIAGARWLKNSEGTYVPLPAEQEAEATVEDFLNLPMPALDNMSPLQAVEHEPNRATVRAILTHLEGVHHLILPPSAINKVYERLQFTRPVQESLDEHGLDTSHTLLDLVRVDIETLTDNALQTMFFTAFSFGIRNLSYHTAAELVRRPRTSESDKLRSLALNILADYAKTVDESLNWLTQLQESLAASGGPVGAVVMRIFTILNRLERRTEAAEVFQQAFMDHPSDPYLLSVIQYAQQQQGQRGNDSGISDHTLLNRMTRRAEAEPESSLLLPGDSAPAEPGKSKLWLPGS